jgi:SHS2 domain-containing protein
MSLMPRAPRHSFEEHTSEIELRLTAGSLDDLFAEAGRALAELMIRNVDDKGLGLPEEVMVQSADRQALLVDWLNELIFRSEVAKKVYVRFRISRLTDRELEATIWGVEPAEIHTVIKAATLHRVQLNEDPDGWSAIVVLDV